MSDKKTDLRIQKTRKALETALFLLLQTQPFSKITVNDLCTQSMVSRSAFYANFEDKYALLRYCIDLIKQKVFTKYDGLTYKDRITEILTHIQKEPKIFKNLTMRDVDKELIEMFRSSFLNDFEKMLIEKQDVFLDSPGPVDIIAVYYSSAFTNVIIY